MQVGNGVVTNGGSLFLLAKNEKILILANRISIMDTNYSWKDDADEADSA